MPAAPESTPPDARWLAAKALYAAASELPDAAAREAWLAAADVDDAVRAEARSLLAHDPERRDSDFLGLPAALHLATAAARTGQRLGPWEIVRVLGSGGMGEVFEVRRADGSYEGRAAAKLLPPGMDNAAVLQRFAQERQALARLNHAHIATLLDAGLSGDGLPFFVMEFVDGRPLDEAARGLTLDQRIALFLQLTDAVAFAHRQLLVHRDLKPGNVLVTAQGQVKLLDFGIAQAIDAPEPATTAGATAAGAGDVTQGALRAYTPHYASPEQVRGEPVGTATDIYSLGVLLYQLLTGLRPTGRASTTAAEAARSVLEETPLPPSEVVGQADRSRLAGDLDPIVMKALQKPLHRRYASVEALQADLRAFQAGLPVSAREPTRAYLLSRFVARHRLPVAAAGLAALALLVGAGAATWQAHQAGLARDEARQRLADLRTVTHDLVFRFGDSIAYLSGGMNIKEDLLNETLAPLQRLADGAGSDTLVIADVSALHARLAELQGNDTAPSTERPQQALAHADAAMALGARAWGERKADRSFTNWLARAYQAKAQLQRAAGEPAQALQTLAASRPLIEESLALQTRNEERAWLLQSLADLRFLESQLYDTLNLPSLNRPAEALQRMDEAVAAYRAQLALGDKALDALDSTGRPEEPKAKASILHALASGLQGRAQIHLKHDEPELALADAEAAVPIQQQAVDLDPRQVPWHDGLMQKCNTLALTLLRLGRAADALPAARCSWNEAQALARSEGGSRWAHALPTLAQQYGRALAGAGRHADAVPVFERAIAALAAQAAAGPNPNAVRRLGWMRTQLSRSQAALGRRAQALALAQQAVDGLRAASGAAPAARDVLLNLGEALAWQAQLLPLQAAALRDQARAAYDRAGALGALKAEHAAARAALG
jgi:serine/threonine protein kinase